MIDEVQGLHVWRAEQGLAAKKTRPYLFEKSAKSIQ
jgi:hypothetical protein